MDRLINENAVLSAIGEWIAHNEHTYTNATEYLRNRVKAIKTAKQEPCEDCISRKDLIEYANNLKDGIGITANDIARFPSIQPKPKTGHWEQYGYSWEDKFKCSECGEEQPKILCGERIIGHWSDYCPNCGADMRESEE